MTRAARRRQERAGSAETMGRPEGAARAPASGRPEAGSTPARPFLAIIYEPREGDPVAAYPCGENPRVEYEPGSQTREQRLGWLAARRELGLPCPGHPLGEEGRRRLAEHDVRGHVRRHYTTRAHAEARGWAVEEWPTLADLLGDDVVVALVPVRPHVRGKGPRRETVIRGPR